MGKTDQMCPGCGETVAEDGSCARCSRKARRTKTRKQTLLLGGRSDAPSKPGESQVDGPASRDALIPDELLAQTEPPSDTTSRPSKPPSQRPSRGNRNGTLVLSNPDDEQAATGEHDGFAPAPSTGGGRGRYNLARQLADADETPRLSRLSQWRTTLTGEHRGRTTIMELSGIAESAVSGTDRHLPKSIGRQLAISAGAGVLLIALAIAGLVFGSIRWVILPALFVPIFALVVYGTLRLVPRVAARIGDRALPFGVPFWAGAGLVMMATVAALLTWGTSEATARVAVAVFPELAPPELRDKKEAEEHTPERELADANMKKGKEARVRPGLLYVPPEFSSADGAFDLVLHFHGYPPLVEDSIVQSEVNALVHISNLGLGGRPYKARFARPDAFDRLVAAIEEEARSLGLADAHVRRVAISTWSAGYGALFQILKDPERDTPIDAVLAMDGLHGSFIGGGREVQLESIEPYIAFARDAVAEDRLFVITHSAITTAEYASSTESANAILAPLGLERTDADATDSPPEVTFATAVTAFPADGRKWLTAASEVHEGDFHVYGYTGRTPEDHIAHLAQMSVTVLPHLERRWR